MSRDGPPAGDVGDLVITMDATTYPTIKERIDPESATELLTALAHPVRLAVFRQLMAHGPDGASAGALGQAVDLAPNALSFHLNRLKQAGLVSAKRAGQRTIYRASLSTMRELVAYLDDTCCNELGGACGPECPPKLTSVLKE